MSVKRFALFVIPVLAFFSALSIVLALGMNDGTSDQPPQEALGPDVAPTPSRSNVIVATIVPPTPLPDRTTCEEIRGTSYRSETEQTFFLANCLPTPVPTRPPPAPPAVPGPDVAGERWVRIDLKRQETSAMIGNQVLYTAEVTTGKEGRETPPGTFYIGRRVENETMTSASIGAEEYYVLEDVLYTQYFTNEGHALHLNYWRPDYYFGQIPSSHGCVGMRLPDAEFFWRFARIGTRVTIF